MPSADDGSDLASDFDPETEAAIRRVVRDELKQYDATGLAGVVRAITQFGSGLLVGVLALSVVTGVLIAFDAPPLLFGLVAVAFLLLVAYGWRLPPFR